MKNSKISIALCAILFSFTACQNEPVDNEPVTGVSKEQVTQQVNDQTVSGRAKQYYGGMWTSAGQYVQFYCYSTDVRRSIYQAWELAQAVGQATYAAYLTIVTTRGGTPISGNL
jgi:hypothetical protein